MSRILSAPQKSLLFGCLLTCASLFASGGVCAKEIVLHSFAGGSDGAHPQAGLLLDAKGDLYGTTLEGGPASAGIVFKVGRSGAERVLYAFEGGADGKFPDASLITDAQHNLYGITVEGGNGVGTVFKLTPDSAQTVLYSFPNFADGEYPDGGLLRDNPGNLYGTTANGGNFNCDVSFGCGVAYKLLPDNTENVLHTFLGGSDGAYPVSGLIADAAGNLYGTTMTGGGGHCIINGLPGCGTVFRITNQGVETVVYAFKGAPDGADPQANLLLDAGGNLYGTTSQGGAANAGTVFRISPDNKERVLLAFDGGLGGANPLGALIADSRNLYGSTSAGGTANLGTVFKLSHHGKETVLYSFKGGSDGANPHGELVKDALGNLYGTTMFGGLSNNGTVFKIARKSTPRPMRRF